MKKGFLSILAIVSFLVAFFLIPTNANALTLKVEKSKDSIKPGEDVSINIKASDIGDDSIQSYNISLSYDSDRVDFKSANGNGLSKVGAGNPISITNENGTITDGTTIATMVFSAKGSAKSQDANFTLNASNCTTISGKDVKPNIISSMVKVVPLSSDATLSSLKIPNATISPKFDKNVTEYKTTIQDITEITVNAIASDPNAKILISDNYKNLQKGDNDIKISVTAENGSTTKTYMVKVTLKVTPTDEELLKASAALKDLKVKNYEFDFAKELKKYNITVPYKITKVKITAEPENPNAKIEILGNNKLKVGRNVVRINVTSEDEQNKETYTLTVNREKQAKKIVQTCPDTTSSKEWILFTVCMIVTFTLGIILGYFLCKKEVLKKIFKKKNKEEELSDTIEIPTTKPKKGSKKQE